MAEVNSFEEKNRDDGRDGWSGAEVGDIRAAAERAPHETMFDAQPDDIRTAAERAPHATMIDPQPDDIRTAAERAPHEALAGARAR